MQHSWLTNKSKPDLSNFCRLPEVAVPEVWLPVPVGHDDGHPVPSVTACRSGGKDETEKTRLGSPVDIQTFANTVGNIRSKLQLCIS